MVPVMLWIRRRPRRGRWPRLFVTVMAVAWLVSLDIFYFTSFAAGAHNASYAIGVMCVAVIFLLPPTLFLPLLAVNHVFYCGRLLQFASQSGRKVVAPLVDGTVSAALAGLAAWFLFQAARGNFFKERTIAERNRALADSNDELREVMAVAAHDLRTPLLGVKNLLDLTALQIALPREQWLAVVREASRTCGDMLRHVTRLLAAHEAEHPTRREPAQPEDLRALCQAAAQRARLLGDAKAIQVTLTLPAEPAVAMVQADTLADVLDNLLGNAIKFSPRATTVEIALAARDSAWRLEVRDEGPGVPEAERAALFKKFHRGSAQPTGGESSTGLGLFIVKTLTEAMGGRASHAPAAGGGSVFAVELPRA
jgi:signal transduction histidine kinase